MTKSNINRRSLLQAGTVAGLAGAFGLPTLSSEARAAASGKEYVFLSIVTQVPFWVDYRNAMKDLEELMGIKATFTGPLDFDTAAQARQLDELIARRPAGILIFPGDPATLAPGIERAVEAGIPITCCIGDVPESPRSTFLGINGVQAGRVGGEMLAQAIGGKGKVILGTFPAPSTLERVEGYKQVFAEKYPEIEVVDVVNDKADPSYAPTAYLQAIRAHPDIVGIGGTDGDSGKGAAIAVTEAGRVGDIKIVAMDRNDDMLPYIEDGTISGAVAQKSYLEIFLAFHMMHWQNTDALKVLPDWKAAGINPLPERIETGVMAITQDNVSQFKH
ncbi:substrate-binding domain-containing protein [Shimia abyssi]|uniref:Monosaccharide ABC transporter substrate-binding protein (CUT2 family) n=1 Tax=Shimia abyssi TaxID=1662395 RepID=A0A2P8F0W5_9RHOB|nr:substrate-binding domain-containing protein [Shimia abyssi]PSL15363.1 monosaccharide ABC transporter substrate-binding protein (CUT2 family) [Shimia abyssi]